MDDQHNDHRHQPSPPPEPCDGCGRPWPVTDLESGPGGLLCPWCRQERDGCGCED